MTTTTIEARQPTHTNSNQPTALSVQPINNCLGIDLGMGAVKLFDQLGSTHLPSFVAVPNAAKVGKMIGLVGQKPPLKVKVKGQEYFVGATAHDFGRPIENLDYERLTGSPEMTALLYGALSRRIEQTGEFPMAMTCLVGLPLEPLAQERANQTVSAIRHWLLGEHCWLANGKEQHVRIGEVKVTSQPAGALFDYLLDDEGKFVSERKALLQKEVGIISVGFNTLELLVIRERAPIQRFTAGSTVGVRRLLELLNPDGHFSLGELDARLRSGTLETGDIIPLWAREVTGVIERKWGQQWKRFARIIVVGGGTLLLGHHLIDRFDGKAILPDQPVLSIARGLYKQSLLHTKRQEG